MADAEELTDGLRQAVAQVILLKTRLGVFIADLLLACVCGGTVILPGSHRLAAFIM